MTTCSRRSVQVRLSVEGDFSITGKCIDALCGHSKDGHTRFFSAWQAFFPAENSSHAEEPRAAPLNAAHPRTCGHPLKLRPEPMLSRRAMHLKMLLSGLVSPAPARATGFPRQAEKGACPDLSAALSPCCSPDIPRPQKIRTSAENRRGPSCRIRRQGLPALHKGPLFPASILAKGEFRNPAPCEAAFPPLTASAQARRRPSHGIHRPHTWPRRQELPQEYRYRR